MTHAPADVIAFWAEAGPARWFARDDAFDAEIRTRFLDLHYAAARRELDAWAETAEGALALLILLDQFPRNLFRGSAHAFATDPLALSFAEAGIARGFDKAAAPALRGFWYLPHEHSERIEDQDRCLALAQAWVDEEGGDADFLKWVHVHRDIILKFGRFPHRNPALGRETTPEERAFLDAGGFSG